MSDGIVAKSSRNENIQIVRGLAALLVVVDHTVQGAAKINPFYAQYEQLGFQLGRFGVLVFFVISGYIMVLTSYSGGGQPSVSPGKFFFNRLRRIFPLYWATTLFVAAFGSRHHADFWTVLIKSLFFMPLLNADGTGMQPVVGQAWTLYYEMFFYLVFGLCLCLRGVYGAVVCSLFFLALDAFSLTMNVQGNAASIAPLLRFYSHYVTLLFVGGVAIGMVEKLGWLKTDALKFPLLVSSGCTLLAIGHFYVFVNSAAMPLASEMLYFALAAAIVGVCVFSPSPRHTGLLAFGVLLGDYSYAIYLTHQIYLGPLLKVLSRVLHGATIFPVIGLSLVLGTAFGGAVYCWVEKPLQSWLGRWLKRKAV